MDISFVVNLLIDFFNQDTTDVIFQLFVFFGWVIIVWLLLFVVLYFYLDYRQGKYKANWKWVLLAVDIPPNNEQSPKAVEQLFAHLAGSLNEPDIVEKYRNGFVQRWFSFEIISIEGYIQFLINTEESLRDLVEAAVYAQYPDAYIIEVDDYTKDVPDVFPNSEYDAWIADFSLAESDAFSIRTYEDFEHSIAKLEKTPMRDPMSAFLESFSRIGPGEQMWFQILVQPISSKWKEKIIKKIKDFIGEKSATSKTVLDKISGAPLVLLEGIGSQIFAAPESSAKSEPVNKLSVMTPGQIKLVERMEEKISKLGFKTKMRGVYLGRKEVFKPNRGVSALLGAINQFNIPTANSLKSKPASTDKKKTLLLGAYKKRKMSIGTNPFIFNIEELATVWHFPFSTVKTPLLQRAEGRKAEPPIALPVERVSNLQEVSKKEERKGYKTDAGDFGYRDDNVKFG